MLDKIINGNKFDRKILGPALDSKGFFLKNFPTFIHLLIWLICIKNLRMLCIEKKTYESQILTRVTLYGNYLISLNFIYNNNNKKDMGPVFKILEM